MLFLYSAFVFALALSGFLIRRRAKSLEARYTRVAREAELLLKQNGYKDGNSNRLDPYLAAKKQYQLGLLAQKRDRVEARYAAWQERADKITRFTARVRAWKGRKLPYAFGVLDVATALAVVDYLGFAEYVNTHTLLDLVRSHLSG
jgi:hypothetical protein